MRLTISGCLTPKESLTSIFFNSSDDFKAKFYGPFSLVSPKLCHAEDSLLTVLKLPDKKEIRLNSVREASCGEKYLSQKLVLASLREGQ